MKNIFKLCLVILLVTLISLNRGVSAEEFSWTSTEPEVMSSNDAPNISSSWCRGFFQTKLIANIGENQKVCILGGDLIVIGNYFADNNFHFVIGASYSSKMYSFNGVCGRSDSCLYLPETDVLVSKQYIVNNLVQSLVVYKNFSNRIIRQYDMSSSERMFSFDYSNPDYIFKSAPDGSYPNGYAWPIGGMGSSANGKWLAVEFRERGIGLLNIDTFEMKRISNSQYFYGLGRDPAMELAVGGDGEAVAVMGVNSGLAIYEVKDGCGDLATDYRMFEILPIADPCKTAIINTDKFIDRFYNAFLPRFNSDGKQLNFFSSSYNSDIKEVLLQTKGYVGQKLDYLAMGDSFQSGEGETDDSFYLNGTNSLYEKCHVSYRSYPFLIADGFGMNHNLVKSVACSGATMGDLVGKDDRYAGQGNRLAKAGINLPYEDQVLYKYQAKNLFLPGRIYQNTFAEMYQPEVITVGIGGNDAGFMDKLRACLGLDSCDWAKSLKGREQTAIEIKNLFPKLVKTYTDIHKASPGSKIYVIGYPKIIEQNGDCGFTLNRLLDDSEIEFINSGDLYLNNVIEAAAKAAGVAYIDIYDSFGDSMLCGGAESKAINSVVFGDDDKLNDNFEASRIIGQESFHPKPLGHILIAGKIASKVGDIRTYNYCNQPMTVVCPDNTVVAPEPSTYWIPNGYSNYTEQQRGEFVTDIYDDGSQKEIFLASKTFEPNSSVRIEINSTPKDIGYFTVNEDGSLNTTIELPADLEEGFHTIKIYGKSYLGEPVEFYQTIQYILPKNDKIDTAEPAENKPIVSDNLISEDYTSLPVASSTIISSSSLTVEIVSSSKNKITKTEERRQDLFGYVLLFIFIALTVLVLRILIKFLLKSNK